MSRIAYFTICTCNYIAYALTLHQSLRRVRPDAEFFLFLADEPVLSDTPPDVNVIPVAALQLPRMREMAFRYTLMEFSTAIKAACFQHLLAERGFSHAVYLDPDIQVFRPLEGVEAAFSDGASAVLTPHLLSPLDCDRSPTDFDILRSGTFNLGFAAFSDTPEARDFLSWWGRKLETDCLVDLERGLFVDQKFVEFAPCFVQRLCILRHPGYNVAYWNLANRHIVRDGGAYVVNGQPLVFFHFSGVVPGRPEILSKHQDTLAKLEPGPVADLVSDYLDRIAANGHERWSKVPYRFGRFSNGRPIPLPMRRHLPEQRAATDWFDEPDLSFWLEQSDQVDQTPDGPLSRLMVELHALRPDLKGRFPLSTLEGRQAFRDWVLTHGVKEFELDPSYLVVSGTASRRVHQMRARLRRIAMRILAG